MILGQDGNAAYPTVGIGLQGASFHKRGPCSVRDAWHQGILGSADMLMLVFWKRWPPTGASGDKGSSGA